MWRAPLEVTIGGGGESEVRALSSPDTVVGLWMDPEDRVEDLRSNVTSGRSQGDGLRGCMWAAQLPSQSPGVPAHPGVSIEAAWPCSAHVHGGRDVLLSVTSTTAGLFRVWMGRREPRGNCRVWAPKDRAAQSVARCASGARASVWVWGSEESIKGVGGHHLRKPRASPLKVLCPPDPVPLPVWLSVPEASVDQGSHGASGHFVLQVRHCSTVAL